MGGTVKLRVRNFKSLVDATIDLAPVAVFIGPPASGKSNILEALETLGYLLRVGVEVWSGIWDSIERVGLLTDYVRLTTCSDLITRYSVTERIDISIESDEYNATATISCLSPIELKARVQVGDGSKLSYEVQAFLAREVKIPSLRLTGKEAEQLKLWLSMIEGLVRLSETAKPPAKVSKVVAEGDVLVSPSPRLYSFDRMNVFKVIQDAVGDRYPLYLEEHGRNLGWLLYSDEALYEEVQAIVRNLANLELRVLSDGRLVFFDGLRDVSTSTVSETVLRVVYVLAGLSTAKRLKRNIEVPSETKGLIVAGHGKPREAQLEPIVMLEEPEAHVYPIAYNQLVDAIREASRNTLVVVTTHSWGLAQLLWEKTGATIYYTVRDERGTIVYRVNVEKAIEEGIDFEELVYAGTARVDELKERGVLIAT